MIFDSEFPLLISFCVFHYLEKISDFLSLRLVNKYLSNSVKFFILTDLKDDFVSWNLRMGLKIESCSKFFGDFHDTEKITKTFLPNLVVRFHHQSNQLWLTGKTFNDKLIRICIPPQDQIYLTSTSVHPYHLFTKNKMYIVFIHSRLGVGLIIEMNKMMEIEINWRILPLGINSLPFYFDGDFSPQFPTDKSCKRRYFLVNGFEIVRCWNWNSKNEFLFYQKIGDKYHLMKQFDLKDLHIKKTFLSEPSDNDLKSWTPHNVQMVNFGKHLIIFFLTEKMVSCIYISTDCNLCLSFWFVDQHEKIWFMIFDDFGRYLGIFVFCSRTNKRFKVQHPKLFMISKILKDHRYITHVANEIVHLYNQDRYVSVSIKELNLTLLETKSLDSKIWNVEQIFLPFEPLSNKK